MTITRIKRWNRFGAIVLSAASIGLVATPGMAAETKSDKPTQADNNASLMHSSHTSEGEGEGQGKAATTTEGEGEGNTASTTEGEGATSPPSLSTDDIAYLAHLGQVRGHLNVGVALYEAGAFEMAVSHMKHPSDELFKTIKPAMQARGAADFSNELAALAKAVESKAGIDQVRAAYQDLEMAIDRTQSVVDRHAANYPQVVYGTVLNLVRTAADEYAIGVKDGKIVNAHEYQDAWGFTSIAKQWLESLTAEQRAGSISAYEKIRAQVDALLASAWPSVVPPETVTGDSSDLYGAAARIELAYRAVDRAKSFTHTN